MTWTCVEPGVYFIAATLPSLRPLVRILFKNVDFGTIYTRFLSASVKTFSTRRQTKDIPLSTVKEAPSHSVASSGDRAGFTKLKDANVHVADEDLLRLMESHDKEGQQKTRRANVEAGYQWE